MATPIKKYFPAIDGIRAVAILAVVLFHLDIAWFKGGFIGVDVFFVISGFLITRNILLAIEDKRFSFRQFYAARIRRLFPALFATILLCLLFGILLLSPDGLIRLSGSAIASALSLANVRFWLVANYFDVDAALKPLLHFWSLSVEEQFYLFWPIGLWLGARYLTSGRLLWAVITVAVASLLASQLYLQIDSGAAFYLVHFRAYEFAIGAAVFLLPSYANTVLAKYPAIAEAGILFGLALIIIPLITFSEHTTFPGLNALFPCVGAAALIYFRDAVSANIVLANKAMRALGRVSYSLYLVHWPVWVYYSYWRGGPLYPAEKLALFLLMLLLAYGLYVSVEKRFRYRPAKADSKDSGVKHSKLLFPGALLTVFCFILVGSWSIRQSSGLPQRITGNYPVLAPVNLNCEFRSGKQFQDCQFGEQDNYKYTVLLIGDSHSMNLRYGLHHYGKGHAVRFKSLSGAGCPPLLGVHLYHVKQTLPDQ